MFIGRTRELDVLRERLTDVRPVAILGEAGVGKTTLVRMAAQSLRVPIVEAGALSTLSWLPYLPLKRAFGVDFGGDAAHVAANVEERLAGSVLFFDDLQWIDTHTIALVPLLAGRVPLLMAVRRGDPGTSGALEAAAAAHAELLPLEPLGQDESEELARALDPTLTQPARRRLAERAGGNPFLLEQLTVAGGDNVDVKRLVSSRLRTLTSSGREALGALALLGRPSEARLLGPGAAEVVAAGLASAGAEITIRHALLAEATVETLDPVERSRLHSRLAAALDDPGEAARHHAEAGERELAFEKASRAAANATTLAERATHLAVAAANADGRESEELRVEAAAALFEIGDHETALALLAELRLADTHRHARAALIRSRVRSAAGDIAGAAEALVGVDDVANDPATQVLISVQRVDLELKRSSDPELTLAHARAAVAGARAAGHGEAEALHVLALAKAEAGRDDGPADLERALASACARGDAALDCRLAEALSGMLFNRGRGREAKTVLSEASARARAAHLKGWERRFRARTAWLDLHLGSYLSSAEEGETLLAEALPPWQRFLVTYITAQASVDLGRHERAAELIGELEKLATGDQHARQILWTRADAAFWAGRPREAIAATDELFARFPHEPSVFARLARAWANADLGRDPGGLLIGPRRDMLEGAGPELEAVSLLVGGRHEEAASCFRRAAELWADRHVRGELRCLWAAGEALRRAGLAQDALEQLTHAEQRAQAHAHLPLVGRVHRSLRAVGARRSAQRTRAGPLTGRESEVLTLIGDGLSDREIALRLGVTEPTVVRLTRSAQRKLGATTRAQAAALAVGE